MISAVERYEPSSYVDLTFAKPTNSREVGRYVASKLEPLLGVGQVEEMAVADAESLVANSDRSKQYFEIHNLHRDQKAFRVRNFLQSDAEASSLLAQFVGIVRKDLQ